MAPQAASTSLARSVFPTKVTIRLPPKLRAHKAVNTKREYRLKKCEMTAELLAKLWHRSPADYDFDKEVELAWSKHIIPMVQTGQVEASRARRDMYMHMDV